MSQKNIRLMRHFIAKLSPDFCCRQISLRFNNSPWPVHAHDYVGMSAVTDSKHCRPSEYPNLEAFSPKPRVC